MAEQLGRCDENLVLRVTRAVNVQNLKTRLPSFGVDDVLEAMKHDKKRAKKRLRFIIPIAPGRCEILDEVSDDTIRAAVAWVVESGG